MWRVLMFPLRSSTSKIFFILLLVVFFNILWPITTRAQDTSLEFRSAAFFHSSKLFREVYGNVGVCYELEASTGLCECLEGWINFDWFSKHNEIGRCASRASIANISFGIYFPYRFCDRLIAYIGVGPSFSEIWLKNSAPCCVERVSKLAFGGILKSGIYYFINRCFFIDLFVDYLYQPVHFETSVNIGGFKTGAGIGIQF